MHISVNLMHAKKDFEDSADFSAFHQAFMVEYKGAEGLLEKAGSFRQEYINKLNALGDFYKDTVKENHNLLIPMEKAEANKHIKEMGKFKNANLF